VSLAVVAYIFLVILVCAAFSEEYFMILTFLYQWNVGQLYLAAKRTTVVSPTDGFINGELRSLIDSEL
jgi:hypothetical protein